MKQVAQNYRSGELTVVDVPPPSCAPGGVLVRTLCSLISTGTELMKVSESKLSLLGKAKARPDQVRKVLDTVAQQGPVSAYKKAMNRLDSYTPLGYSLAGVVVEVGRGAEEFSVGQVVACAGNEYAFHAELNWVPVNLCVPVPDGVPPRLAAFATVGAIAMQGVRQGTPQLGDTACVIGLGLVGQLVVQLLVASGVRVVGLDVVPERCRLAEKAGALLGAAPDPPGVAAIEAALAGASGGLGADRIFLVAGGSSNEPVEVAARLARDRATIVDIGKCHLDLPWNDYYEKELDLRFSRSYGPGRYDPRYELEGIDYPAGYVRWTERRNLACFLDLIAKGDVDPEPLVSGIFPVTDAVDVYERLSSGALHGVGFLFDYPEGQDPDPVPATAPKRSLVPGHEPRVARSSPRPRPEGTPVRLGFIGAGNYASSMLLPHLGHRPDVNLAHVATNRSLSALNAQKKFGFELTSTDAEAVLSDRSIDAVFIVTRHSSHADLACRALEAGKAVFVEKPMALSLPDVERILATVDATGNDRLMVGFNRRFSPMLVEMRARFGPPRGVTVVRYLVNAGRLSAGSWYGDAAQEGTRFAGEGGHFIDTASWWIGADPQTVTTTSAGGPDDVQVTIGYGDGSLATITYLSSGHPRFPKETLEIFSDGRSARLDNFKQAAVWSGRRRQSRRALGAADKGQRAELEAFLAAVRTGGPMPIALGSLVATTRATIVAGASLVTSTTETV
ncbi:MAG TPA: bi-domain-containing oxidoreductase [Acidimicrobiales bacterium]|nr:bi-domain-containing oxidoreductase [Acidimicrobiales bacterium]